MILKINEVKPFQQRKSYCKTCTFKIIVILFYDLSHILKVKNYNTLKKVLILQGIFSELILKLLQLSS